MPVPTPTVSIGDFSRATHVSVKMLRHYHQIGLLEPAAIDPDTGYRRYGIEQIPTAQVIRRFRDMDMPLEHIGAVLAAPDLETRNELINLHLDALHANLAQTQSAIASLRNLLAGPSSPDEPSIALRRVAATPAAAISALVDLADIGAWYHGAIGELTATLSAQRMEATGPAGGIYANELFEDERGQATVFVPCRGTVRPVGRVEATVVPPTELAVIVHAGAEDIDRAYGTLGAYVTRHALAVAGPIREYYLVGPPQTPNQEDWRTEIGWPVFGTAASS